MSASRNASSAPTCRSPTSERATSPTRPPGKRVLTGTGSIPTAPTSNWFALLLRKLTSKRSASSPHGRSSHGVAWFPRTTTTLGLRSSKRAILSSARGASVGVKRCARRPLPGEAAGALRPPLRQLGRERIVLKQPPECRRDRLLALRIEEQRGVAGHLWQRPAVGAGDRRAVRHGLENGQAEAFDQRRQGEAAGKAVEPAEIGIGDPLGEADAIGHAKAGGERS